MGDVGGVTDVDEAVGRNVSSVEDMDKGWRYDTYFEMGVDLEIVDTASYLSYKYYLSNKWKVTAL